MERGDQTVVDNLKPVSAEHEIAEIPASAATLPTSTSDVTSTTASLAVPETRLTQAGRPVRNYRLPRRFQDIAPDPVAPVRPEPALALPSQSVIRRVILHVQDSFHTAVDQFGVLRRYFHRPSYDPDAFVKAEDLANFRTLSPASPRATPTCSPPWPFNNMSKYLLMNWYHTGSSQKTKQEVTRLVKEVITSPDFSAADLADFNAHQENKRLDYVFAEQIAPFSGDNWHEVEVEIDVPVPERNKSARKYSIYSLHHRSITEVIKAVWGDAVASQKFHLTPFKRIHVDPEQGTETRIFDEMYT